MIATHVVLRHLRLRYHSRLSIVGVTMLAALLGGVACLPNFSAAPAGGSAAVPQATATAAVRIGKAVRGDLSGVLTFTAEVRAKGRIGVVPRVTARLDRLAVSIGSRVHAGDTLAELDRSGLEQQVLEAQAAQASAEAKLAELKAGPRPEAQTMAQANLAAAQARLKALEAAQSSSASAEALQRRVEDARAKLEQASSSPEPDAAAVAQANAAVAAARTKLNAITGDPNRSKDQNAVDAARRELQQAQDAAAAASKQTPPSQAAIDQARGELQDAQQAQFQQRLAPTAFDLDQARALVDVADAQLKLVSAPATDDQIRAAQATAEQAFALAELARAYLNDTTITAPVNAVVVEVSAQTGATVGPTAAIVTLIPPELQAAVNVDESQATQLEVGQTVQLSVDSLPQDVFQGVVKGIAPILDPRTRTVAVEIEVPDPRGKLRPGTFSQLQIQTGSHHDAVLVPKDAVLRMPALEATPAQTLVYLVVDNRVRRQKVTVGASDSRNVEVLQGLNEGADVVVNPTADLIDGQLIISG